MTIAGSETVKKTDKPKIMRKFVKRLMSTDSDRNSSGDFLSEEKKSAKKAPGTRHEKSKPINPKIN